MRILIALAFMAGAMGSAAGEFTFDAAEFERKPWELGGYLEYRHDRLWLNRDGALYGLAFYNREALSRLDRDAAALKLEGKLTLGSASVRGRTHLEYTDDNLGGERTARFDELVASWKPDPGFTLEAGKVALKWGKGYAWNPVGFVERLKDPNDPELAREGYWIGTADWVRTFEGPLKTVAFTPVVLPTGTDVNSDYGRTGRTYFAAKLYLLWYDTDIDFVYLADGSRTPRFGFDFSRNSTSNLEVHGEWARVKDAERRAVTSTGAPQVTRGDADSYLLGMRYLTAGDTTYIAEYYRNGSGYSKSEMESFFSLIDSGLAGYQASSVDALLRRASAAAQAGYSRAQAMGRYAYLRISQKDPFDILYFTPAITSIVNLSDHSFSVSPELAYTGFTNVELRLRFFYLKGREGSDFGEKQNSKRVELRARLYF
ncbi:MAG: hypothetical protein ACXW2A_14255 [Burkholderiales bacterium]